MSQSNVPQELIAPLEASRRVMEFRGRQLDLTRFSVNSIWLSLTNRNGKPGNSTRGITFHPEQQLWQVRFNSMLVASAPHASEARFLQLQFLHQAFGKLGLELDRISRLQPYVDGEVGYLPMPDGRFAVVDAADFPRCAVHSWNVKEGCVQTNIRKRHVALYRMVLGLDLPSRVKPVHHDGDRLNCRRANLGVLNYAEATWSGRKIQTKTTSDYKGVSWIKDQALWRSKIKKGGKIFSLGDYRSEWAAAKAYDEAAREMFGEFAAVNFPRPGELAAHRPKDANVDGRIFDTSLAA
jgi:hypothetical protein